MVGSRGSGDAGVSGANEGVWRGGDIDLRLVTHYGGWPDDAVIWESSGTNQTNI